MTELLGEGGMGQVYRATDLKLKRDVALKVLPEAFTRDPQRMARFEREAQVLASLNHPNIGAIFGLEDSGQTQVLVLELIEGETLDERMQRGRIPLDECLRIAFQIADALEAAHEKGIVHRDLKPANVKITPEGTAKVLDFGLAKAAEQSSQQDVSQSPTLTMQATQAGLILGTAAYMSPEQARGETVDQRSDIWAFGVVLYEMVTGRSLFSSKTISDTLAAVLTREPDWEVVPPRARHLLQACLEREPAQRLRDIGDSRLLIGKEDAAAPRSSARGSGIWILATLAALVLGVVVGFLVFRSLHPDVEQEPIRFFEYPPEGGQFAEAPAPSPDGRFLAMRVSSEEGEASIWVRALHSPEARHLDGTEGAESLLIWSPDSSELILSVQGEIRRLNRDGNDNRLVARIPGIKTGVWAPDNNLYLSVKNSVIRLSPDGGTPKIIVEPGQGDFRRISLVPTGTHLLLFQFGGQTGFYTCRLDGSDLQALKVGATTDTDLRFVSENRFLYQAERVLLAQNFDSSSMQLVGDPVPLAQNLGRSGFNASDSGVVTLVDTQNADSQLARFDREGYVTGTLGPDGQYQELVMSPRGDQLLFVAADPTTGNLDIWLQDLSGNPPVRFTSSPEVDHWAVFSTDGQEIAWERHRGSDLIVMRRPLNSSVPETLVTEWNRGGGPADWSRDGRYLLYNSYDGSSFSNLWIVPVTDDEQPYPLVESEFEDVNGRFSPDQQWLAYVSDASGQDDVYLHKLDNFKRVGGPLRVSTAGGSHPIWRSDGRELFFLQGSQLMAVDIQPESDRPAGIPKALFDLGFQDKPGVFGSYRYAVAPDGQSFLAIRRNPAAAPNPASVILGLASEEGH